MRGVVDSDTYLRAFDISGNSDNPVRRDVAVQARILA